MPREDRAPLRRAIGLPRATALVVGTIIGASIFVQPSEVTGRVPSLTGSMAVWLVSGILTVLGALVVAELGAAFPETGGVYVFLRRLFSPLLGFLWGWAMFWTMHTGILAVIAIVFARYLGYFVPLGPLGAKLAAAGAILALTAINLLGVKPGSRLQTALTVIKVAAIVLLVAAGIVYGPPQAAASGANLEAVSDISAVSPVSAVSDPSDTTSLGDFLLAVAAGLFAYGGWHMVTYSAGETREPRRTVPRALITGTLIVTACYMALNAIYFRVLPLETVIHSDRVAADAADAILGSGGGAVMAALVIVSTFGALSGIVLAGPRVYLAMAQDGLLFPWAGKIHPRFRTPHVAIVLQGLWASVLAMTGTYRVLFTRVIYTEWIFFGLLALGVYQMRRRMRRSPRDAESRPDTFRAPVWVPAVFAFAAFSVVANQVISEPRESLVGLGFVLLGVPVYWIWGRRLATRQGSEP
ncbi:MAG: amino acid permease [Acidobacteria bacterium]|nr:amino acid permease [Acidobacteriota bacterium]